MRAARISDAPGSADSHRMANSSPPYDEVAGADVGLEAPRHLPDEAVAGGMAQGFVNVLEAVDVELGDDGLAAAAFGVDALALTSPSRRHSVCLNTGRARKGRDGGVFIEW